MEKNDFQEENNCNNIWLKPERCHARFSDTICRELISFCNQATQEYIEQAPICTKHITQITHKFQFIDSYIGENHMYALLQRIYNGFCGMVNALNNKNLLWLDGSSITSNSITSNASPQWILNQNLNLERLREFFNPSKLNIIHDVNTKIANINTKIENVNMEVDNDVNMDIDNEKIKLEHVGLQQIYEQNLTEQERDTLGFSQNDQISILDIGIVEDANLRELCIYTLAFLFAPEKIKLMLIEVCWITHQISPNDAPYGSILHKISQASMYTVLDLTQLQSSSTLDLLKQLVSNLNQLNKCTENEYTDWYTSSDITQISVLRDFCSENDITNAYELFRYCVNMGDEDILEETVIEDGAKTIESGAPCYICGLDISQKTCKGIEKVFNLSTNCHGDYNVQYPLQTIKDVFIEIEFLCGGEQKVYISFMSLKMENQKIMMNIIPMSVHEEEMSEEEDENGESLTDIITVNDLQYAYSWACSLKSDFFKNNWHKNRHNAPNIRHWASPPALNKRPTHSNKK